MLPLLEFEPPLVACVVSDRNMTFDTLKATRECVINIATVELAKQAVACGNVSGRQDDQTAVESEIDGRPGKGLRPVQ